MLSKGVKLIIFYSFNVLATFFYNIFYISNWFGGSMGVAYKQV